MFLFVRHSPSTEATSKCAVQSASSALVCHHLVPHGGVGAIVADFRVQRWQGGSVESVRRFNGLVGLKGRA